MADELSLECDRCGKVTPKVITKGQHIAAYCSICRKFVKFVPKTDAIAAAHLAREGEILKGLDLAIARECVEAILLSAQHFYTVQRDSGPSKLPEELKPYAEALHGLFKNAAMAAYCLSVPSESEAGRRYVEELKRERSKEHLA